MINREICIATKLNSVPILIKMVIRWKCTKRNRIQPVKLIQYNGNKYESAWKKMDHALSGHWESLIYLIINDRRSVVKMKFYCFV